jgi:uncharacterized protein (DUF885 family)
MIAYDNGCTGQIITRSFAMKILAFLVLGLVSLASHSNTGPALKETARFNAWLDARYEEELAFSPLQLTSLGRKNEYDQVDDLSEAAELEQYRWLEQTVGEMKRKFAYEKLTPEGKVSYDYWIYRQQLDGSSLPFVRYDYTFNQESGAHSELPQFLINLHTVDTEQDMVAYIARIKGMSRALGQLLERSQVAAKEGIRPPRFAYESVLEVSGKVISGAPFGPTPPKDSPIWADANEKIAKLVEQGLIDQKQAELLRQKTAVALRKELLPAYQNLISWLQLDLPNTDAEARGVYALPNGRAYYSNRLAVNTTTALNAAEIHQLGLAEVARIRGEMEKIRQALGFEGTLEQFFEFIRRDEKFYYSNDDVGRQAYLEATEKHLEFIEAGLPDYFGVRPKADLVVKRVPQFMEQDGAAAFYKRSTADGSRPGTYYLHLSDMSAMNKTSLETTAYHEGLPGHHMQLAIALERQDLPLFRTVVWYSAYGEGWALYAEHLAREMGAFDTLYSDFGQLVSEMFRAIRLVVDTGLHDQGWTEQQAVDYMLANSSIPEVAVRSEIRRYLVWPGQATSYKVGMLKILELRESARQALGNNFDIRGFHDAVLGGGSLPLPILEQRVDQWVADMAARQQHAQ